MFRAAVVLHLLAATGSALAQPPAPARPPVPVQPFPPQGPVPVQPPTVVFTPPGGRAPAATGPRLVVARIEDGSLVWSSSEMVPTTRQIDVPVVENGEQVTRRVTTTSFQPTTKQTAVPLDGLKFKDGTGKRIQPLALEIRLGKGAGVVLHTGPIADEIRAMFKDDAVFVEMPGGTQQFAQPAFITPPGAPPQFVQPGLALPAAVPQPALPRPPAPQP